MIKNTDWITLADYVYDGDDRQIPQKDCIVYVPTDNIAEFFDKCQFSEYEYIVISANSDYGVHLQKDSPVWADMKKWLNFVQFTEVQQYSDLHLHARCNHEQCKISDRYSVKVYSYTNATFSHIPHNIIKWYGTNLNIYDRRIVRIPFGIPEWTAHLVGDPGFHRKNKIYVNFQTNTVERVQLIQYAQQNEDFVVKNEVSKEEYIKDLQTYKYVLCPEGNGLDSYRILETLYCGAIPILVKNTWNENLYKGNAIYISNLSELNVMNLDMVEISGNQNIINFQYWKDNV